MQTTNQKGIVKLTKAQYNTLVSTGSVTDGSGQTFTYQDGYIYCTDEVEYVSFAEPQLLTPEQQAQARANIGAGSGSGGTEVYVNGVLQQTLNFDSDPQTQINAKVPTSRTIAGLNLSQNRTAIELRTALNVEDGAEVNEVNDVEIDDVSCVTGTTAEIRTINGDYNASTNRLATANDISDKVDETSSANKVYGTDSNGDQTTYDTARTPQTIGGGKIPLYNAAGCLKTNSPTWAEDATPKSYVDGLSMVPTNIVVSQTTIPTASSIYFTAPENGVAYLRFHSTIAGTALGFHLRSSSAQDLAYNTQKLGANNDLYDATFVMKKGQQIYCYENNAGVDWGGLYFVQSGV